MKYIFGPVPSRRLGRSLGIDPIPLKTCNWNCVYCQLGRTKPVTNERKNYFPVHEILGELDRVLADPQADQIDWITIVGSGEPTLHADIGKIIRGIKLKTDIPVAVITNGSLLHSAQVQTALLSADAVLPSLDAGHVDLYRRINRPHPANPYEQYVGGLQEFREIYRGNFWVEVMLVKGLNDSSEELQAIGKVLSSIDPDEIHISLPTRPPAEPWVEPPGESRLQEAIKTFGERTKILYAVQGKYGMEDTCPEAKIITEIASRHPIPDEEITIIFNHLSEVEIHALIKELQSMDLLQLVERNNKLYWVAGGAYFPEDSNLQGRVQA
jgi:wyosine [tRNA(Phe)-imidazoG37] synthetase (radical SAM superfamily)